MNISIKLLYFTKTNFQIVIIPIFGLELVYRDEAIHYFFENKFYFAGCNPQFILIILYRTCESINLEIECGFEKQMSC
jgi:hypothetical protein